MHTQHLYDNSEIVSLHHKAVRLQDEQNALFAACERDMTGQGNAAFADLFLYVCEDKMPSENPSNLAPLLALYDEWKTELKKKFKKDTTGLSSTVPAARQLLGVATLFVTRLKTERLPAFASMIGVHLDPNNVDTLWKGQSDEVKQSFARCLSLQKTTATAQVPVDVLAWLPRLVAAEDDQSKTRLDATLVMTKFLQMLYLSAQSFTAGAADATHQAEKALVHMAHVVWTLHSIEQQKVDMGKVAQESWLAQLQKIVAKHTQQSTDTCLAKIKKLRVKQDVSFHIWISLIVAADRILSEKYKNQNGGSAKCRNIMCTLLVLFELYLRNLGQDLLGFLCACILVGRGEGTIGTGSFAWNLDSKERKKLEDDARTKEMLALYDELAPTWNVKSPVTEALKKPADVSLVTADSLAKRRKVAIPSFAIDKHTQRGAGRDTRGMLEKYLTYLGLPQSIMSQEERRKSHGVGLTWKKSAGDGEDGDDMMDEDDADGPTQSALEHFWQHLEIKATDLDRIYFDDARKLYLDEEGKYGFGEAKASKAAARMYRQRWTVSPLYSTVQGTASESIAIAEKVAKKRKIAQISDEGKEDGADEEEEQQPKGEPKPKSRKLSAGNQSLESSQEDSNSSDASLYYKKPVDAIVELSKDDLKLLSDGRAPIAQKPTSAGKKRTYMLSCGAFKGPFSSSEKQVTLVNSILVRTEGLRLLGDTTPVEQRPIRYEAPKDGSSSDAAESGIYLYSPYPTGKQVAVSVLQDTKNATWETTQVKGHERVLVLSNIGDITGIKPASDMPGFTEQLSKKKDLAVQVLKNLLARYLLGIGDVHTRNLLVTTGADFKVYSCDFDDNRGTIPYHKDLPGDEQSRVRRLIQLVFTKAPPAAQRAHWEAMFSNDKILLALRKWIDSEVANALQSLEQLHLRYPSCIPGGEELKKRVACVKNCLTKIVALE